MSGDDSLILRGEFDGSGINQGVKDTAAAMEAIRGAADRASSGIRETAGSIQRAREATSPWAKELEKATEALQDNVLRLQAQKELLADPVQAASMRRTADLRREIESMTKAILDEEKAEATLLPDVRAMTDAMGQQTAALRAQLEAMKSVEGQGYLKAQQSLKAEMGELTKATTKHDEVEKGVFSNMRTRREVMVMAHEAMMGQTKNLMGSAMVFAEYADLSIMHAATAMINPYTIAAAAIAGVTIAMTEMSSRAAEHYHELHLVGLEVGATADQMAAFEQASIGTGVSSKELGTALSHFTLNLSRHREELARAGVTAKEPIEAFEQLMDVASRTSDPVQRNALLNVALGESYRKMVPFIEQGGDALRIAIEKMKFPDGTKEDFEEMNNLAIANSRAWALIKKNSSEAMSGVASGWAEYKAGFMDRWEKDNFFRAALNVVNPFDDALMARGRQVAEAMKKEKGDKSSDILLPSEEANKYQMEAHAAAVKTSRTKMIAEENADYQKRLAELKKYNISTEELTEAHAAKIDEINEKWRKKDSKKKHVDTTARDAADKESHDMVARLADIEKHNSAEKDKASKKREDERKSEDADVMRQARIREQKWTQEDKLTEKMAGYWRNYYNEVEEMREKDRERVQGYYLSISTSSSSVLSNALLSEKGFFDATVEGFRNMLKQMLAELAANAAVFGFLNLVSGGTADKFAGGLGGLSGLVLNGFDVGTRSVQGDQIARIHDQETIFPRPVSQAMRQGDWGPAMQFMGQSTTSHSSSSSQTNHYGGAVTIHVHGGGDARAVAQEVARVLPRATASASAGRRQSSF